MDIFVHDRRESFRGALDRDRELGLVNRFAGSRPVLIPLGAIPWRDGAERLAELSDRLAALVGIDDLDGQRPGKDRGGLE